MPHCIHVNNVAVDLDKEGYLLHLPDWTPEIAKHIAKTENIELTEAHWEIIKLLRQFYTEFNLSPSMRPLVKYTRQHLTSNKGNSLYLTKLFPGSPPKIGAKIAGLPRPANCI